MDIKCSTCKGKYTTGDISPEDVAPYFNESLGDTETTRHITSRCNCVVDGVLCRGINMVEIKIPAAGEEASSASTE